MYLHISYPYKYLYIYNKVIHTYKKVDNKDIMMNDEQTILHFTYMYEKCVGRIMLSAELKEKKKRKGRGRTRTTVLSRSKNAFQRLR